MDTHRFPCLIGHTVPNYSSTMQKAKNLRKICFNEKPITLSWKWRKHSDKNGRRKRCK